MKGIGNAAPMASIFTERERRKKEKKLVWTRKEKEEVRVFWSLLKLKF
jgi:hypothetical protein